MHILVTLFFFSQVFSVSAQNLSLENALDNQLFSINANSLDQLVAFGFIDSKEAQLLAQYFAQGVELYAPYQLQGILGFDSLDVQKLRPFIDEQVVREVQYHLTELQLRYQLLYQLPTLIKQDEGLAILKDTSFEGANFGLQQRVFINWNKWKAGVQLAKDLGEPLWHKGNQAGFEFLSGHISYMNSVRSATLQKWLLGAYELQWGQGLLLWSTRGMGKSIDLLQLARNAQGLKPYMGKDEQRFLQGIAGQLQIGQHQLLLFSSIKRLDAKTPIDSLQPEFNLVYTNGLHRTDVEISKRKQGLEQIYGVGVSKQKQIFQYGALFLYQSAHFIANQTTDTLIVDALKPKTLRGLSLYGQGTWRQFYFYGELVNNQIFQKRFLLTTAINAALIVHLDAQLELGLHTRYYGTNYQTFYANPIANHSAGSNEQGFILQLKWRPVKFWEFKLSTDWTCFPNIDLPQQYPTAYSSVRLYLQYQASKHNYYRCQANWQAPLLSMKALRCSQQLVYQLNKSNSFDFELQTQFAIFSGAQSRHLAIGWTFQPLAAQVSFEIHYGFYQVAPSSPMLYASAHLMGFGTRSILMTGVGSYVLSAVQFDLFRKLSLAVSLYLNNCISINYSEKINLSLALQKKN
ncbi:MAG: hypothetical protein ACKOWX_06875 [Flavobacteriales bacterium]